MILPIQQTFQNVDPPDVYVAIPDVFKRMRRQLQNYITRQVRQERQH